MKKFLASVLALCMLSSLCACGTENTAAKWQEQYDLGVKYLNEGDYEQAVVAFTAAINIDPKRAEAYVGRGDSYVGIAKTGPAGADELYKKAQADYEAAAKLDPSIDLKDKEARLKEAVETIEKAGLTGTAAEIEADAVAKMLVDGAAGIDPDINTGDFTAYKYDVNGDGIRDVMLEANRQVVFINALPNKMSGYYMLNGSAAGSCCLMFSRGENKVIYFTDFKTVGVGNEIYAIYDGKCEDQVAGYIYEMDPNCAFENPVYRYTYNLNGKETNKAAYDSFMAKFDCVGMDEADKVEKADFSGDYTVPLKLDADQMKALADVLAGAGYAKLVKTADANGDGKDDYLLQTIADSSGPANVDITYNDCGEEQKAPFVDGSYQIIWTTCYINIISSDSGADVIIGSKKM